MYRWIRPLVSLAAAGLLVSACGGSDDPLAGGDGAGTPVTVGSTNFSEQLLLANMYSQVLQAGGYEVSERFNLGNREVVFPALVSGEIDVLPEYTGALLAFLTQGEVTETDTDALVEAINAEVADEGLVALEPSPAQDRDALVVTAETAQTYDLQTVSDLAPVAGELVVGGPAEMETRATGLPGLAEVYGIEFAEFRALDAGGPLTTAALASGEIDVARMFTTQGVIGEEGWVVLEEDKPLVPAENLIPVVREDVLDGRMRDLLNAVSAALSNEVLIELNKRIDVDKEDPDAVARDWLTAQGLLEG